MAGRHFLQIPGPTNVPDRVLRAMDLPTMDHRGPKFAELGQRVLEGRRAIVKTVGRVVVYPASGTGAWEAALANTLSPGDRVLMYETGHFAALWKTLAERLGLKPEFIAGDWRSGADPAAIGRHAAAMTRGLQEGGVVATPKHFPGFGAVDTDPHFALAEGRSVVGVENHTSFIRAVRSGRVTVFDSLSRKPSSSIAGMRASSLTARNAGFVSGSKPRPQSSRS